MNIQIEYTDKVNFIYSMIQTLDKNTLLEISGLFLRLNVVNATV